MSSFFRKSQSANNPSTTSLDYRPYNDDADSLSPYPIPLAGMSTSNLSTGPPPPPIRTPSPTPSDVEELNKGAVDWAHLLNWRTWAQRKYLWYYVFAIVFGVIAALLTIYHKQLVNWLTPGAQYLRKLPGGWSIPIGIMFVLSFPPLFGNEIVHVLCGIVWGLWIGFGIVCAGTFLGEIGNFYAFRLCCQARGEKLEKTSLPYACLAQCVRDGGFVVALVARLSAIPGHFTTAVFSTCGMSIWTFCLGAFLSLPKQFATVYIGVILFEAAGVETTHQKIVSGIVVTLSLLITVFAAWWIYHKMALAKPIVLARRRKEKAQSIHDQKMYSLSNQDVESGEYGVGTSNASQNPFKTPGGSTSTITPYTANGKTSFNQPFNYDGSAVNLPLSVKPQRWDQNGRAILDQQYDPSPIPDLTFSSQPPQHFHTQEPPSGAPPNILVTRASQVSTTSGPNRGQSYDDVSLVTPTRTTGAGASYDARQRSPPTSYTAPGNVVNTTRRSDDQNSSDSGHGPQWRAGTTRDDEKEVTSPLTAAMRNTDLPNTQSPGRPQAYPGVNLYNPYDVPGSAGAGGHRYEATDASEASFHTAQGSSGGPSQQPSPRSSPGYSTQHQPEQDGQGRI